MEKISQFVTDHQEVITALCGADIVETAHGALKVWGASLSERALRHTDSAL